MTYKIPERWRRRLVPAGLGVSLVLLAASALAQEAQGDPFGGGVDHRTLFDPEGPMGWLTPRVLVWVLAQLHLLFAAFVLAVPMFVVIIELMGILSKDRDAARRYDAVAHEFCKLLTTAFSITSILGAIFTFCCIGLYPRLFNYLADVFGPSMYLYATIFFGESFSLYLYYYGWGKFSKIGHWVLGLCLNAFGITLMLIANAWTTFMMAPAGLDETGRVIDRSAAFWNFLLHPINIHRLIANMCMGGSVAAAYAAYKWLSTTDPEKRAHYDWMGYIGNFIAILALLPLPFAGYYLGYEIYMFNQQLGIYMMGGVLSWLFVMQAVLIGALFFAANYYLWLGMDRIEGAERFRGWIKFLLGVIAAGVLVWATPKSIGSIATSSEIDKMGGTNHPVLSLFGVMSAKNTAVNLIILATFLSFLLYRRGNKQPTVSWAKVGTAIQALAFGTAAATVVFIGVGGYIPSLWLESTKRVAMSPYQVIAVLSCIVVVMIIDIPMLRNAKEIGKIRWGQVSRRSQYTLLFLAISFTWLMALMGFVRSSLRQHWHVYEVLKDTSPDAYTPSIGYATTVVTVVVVLFFLLVGMVVWISSLGSVKAASERPPAPLGVRLARFAAVAGVIALAGWGVARLSRAPAPKPNPELAELKDRATQLTAAYDVVNPERGVYQIPVDRAIALLESNPSLLAPVAGEPVDLDEMGPLERGEYYFQKKFACSACHSTDGTVKQAPTLLGRYGKPSPQSDGSEVLFDEAYVRESVYEPQKKLAKGFDKSKNPGSAEMTPFAGQISAAELADLLTYIKSL